MVGQRLAHQIAKIAQTIRAADHDQFRRLRALHRLACDIHKSRDRHHHDSARILQLVADFRRGIGGVDRRDGSARKGHAMKHEDIFRHIGRQKRDHLARRQPFGCQPARQCLYLLLERVACKASPRRPFNQRHLIAARVQTFEQTFRDRDIAQCNRAMQALKCSHMSSLALVVVQRQKSSLAGFSDLKIQM